MYGLIFILECICKKCSILIEFPIFNSSEKSSCALSVCVGAASDPLPGLAHITGTTFMHACMYTCMDLHPSTKQTRVPLYENSMYYRIFCCVHLCSFL